ncbi:MAG: hypothetical protein ACFFD1_00065 [Candidatus Thorarchaeota archaeon]
MNENNVDLLSEIGYNPQNQNVDNTNSLTAVNNNQSNQNVDNSNNVDLLSEVGYKPQNQNINTNSTPISNSNPNNVDLLAEVGYNSNNQNAEGNVGLNSGAYNYIRSIEDAPANAKLQALYRGALKFGATVANMAIYGANKFKMAFLPDELAKFGKKMINKHVTNQEKIYEKNKEQYPGLGLLSGIGEFGSSFVLPVGKVAELPGAVAKLAPYGLKTAAKYGTAAISGSALGGLFSGMHYDPNSESGFNVEAAKNAAISPISMGLGIGGAALAGYGSKASKFAEAKGKSFGIPILNRDLASPAKKGFLDTIWAAIPGIGDYRRLSQNRAIFPATQKLIKTMSKEVADQLQLKGGASSHEIINQASQKVFNTAQKRITQAEDAVWAPINANAKNIRLDNNAKDYLFNLKNNFIREYGEELKSVKPGLYKYINDRFIKNESQNIKEPLNLLNESSNVLKETSSGTYSLGSKIKNTTNETTNKGIITFENLKNYKSRIQKMLGGDTALSHDAKNGIKKYISDLYDNLDNSIAKVNPALVDKYHEATAFTREKYNMFDNAGDTFVDAINKTTNAYYFTDKLVREKNPATIGKMLSPFTNKETMQLKASVIGSAVKNSINEGTGKMDLNKFLNLTGQNKNLNAILGENYQALKGLREIMQPINEALKLQNPNSTRGVVSRTLQKITTYGVPAATYLNPVVTAEIAAPVSVLNLISQYSPLKRTLAAIPGIKNNPELLDYMTQKASNLLQRSGFVLQSNNQGVEIDHKDNK